MLLEKEIYFRNFNNLNVFIVTWNIDEKKPPENLSLILKGNLIDLYVFCFQEIDMSAESVIRSSSSKKEIWINSLTQLLNTSYILLESIQVGTCFLAIFLKNSYSKNIQNLSSSSIALGSMGLYNKSAVAIRFEIFETLICFVCSHLTQGRKQIKKRNAEVSKILSELNFQINNKTFLIEDHDEIFWAGDFNYRLNIPDTDSRNKFNDTEYLFRFEQLIPEMKSKRVFVGFQEAPIKFKQSYKYNRFSNEMDTTKKARGPAWCDRILFKSIGNSNYISCKEYNINTELLMSDHRPIYGIFEIKTWTSNNDKILELYKEIQSTIHSLVWKTNISTNFIDFGFITKNDLKTESFIIKNEGNVPILFSLSSNSPWLDYNPKKGTIKKGKSIEIFISFIDRQLNRKACVQNPNIFGLIYINFAGNHPPSIISITANIELEVFDLPIEYLTRLWNPIALTNPNIFIPLIPNKFESSPISQQIHLFDIPSEIFILCDELINIAQNQNLFFNNGNPEEISLIFDFLKERKLLNQKFNENSVAESLIIFLSSIPEPIIPTNALSILLKKGNTFLNVCELLKSEKIKTLNYLIGFIQYLYNKIWKSSKNLKEISIFFGKILINQQEIENIECYHLWTEIFFQLLLNGL